MPGIHFPINSLAFQRRLEIFFLRMSSPPVKNNIDLCAKYASIILHKLRGRVILLLVAGKTSEALSDQQYPRCWSPRPAHQSILPMCSRVGQIER